jgi:transposase
MVHLHFSLLFLLSLTDKANKFGDKHMFVLGFDVAKDHHDVALTNKSGQLKQRWQIANTTAPIEELLSMVKRQHPKLRVGCEATGSYHQLVMSTGLKLNIPCHVLNPLSTKQYTKSTIRGRKTDRDDALSIARLVLRGEGNLVSVNLLNPARNYVRLATKVQQHIHALKLEQRYLSELTDKPAEAGFSTAVAALDQLTTDLRLQATKHIDPVSYQLLTSLVGVGPAIAVSLSAEIGDIHRFPGAKQLVAYAGLDPRVRQSGTVLNRNTRLTKRGSAELRHSLFLAANIARQHDPELKAYYQKKRSEGRTYTEATVATARKLIYRVFAVLSRGTPYVKST